MMKILLIFTFLLFSTTYAEQSPESFERVLKIEKYRRFPYDDVTGKRLSYMDVKNKKYKGTPTIGYGVVMTKSQKQAEPLFTIGISKKTAYKWAKNHRVRKEVAKRISRLKTKLTQDQEDVLHEAGYNLGGPQLGRILRTIDKHGIEAGAKHLEQFVNSKGYKLPGLVKRRKHEANRLRGIE